MSVSYEEGYDSLIDAGLDGMSDDDVETMIDDIADGKHIDITIPDEITRKYGPELSPEEKEKVKIELDEIAKKLEAIFKTWIKYVSCCDVLSPGEVIVLWPDLFRFFRYNK